MVKPWKPLIWQISLANLTLVFGSKINANSLAGFHIRFIFLIASRGDFKNPMLDFLWRNTQLWNHYKNDEIKYKRHLEKNKD